MKINYLRIINFIILGCCVFYFKAQLIGCVLLVLLSFMNYLEGLNKK